MYHFNQDPCVPMSPCNGCKDRCLGCHGVCRAYKKWAAETAELNRVRRAKSYSATSTRPEARGNERERKRKRKKMLEG